MGRRQSCRFLRITDEGLLQVGLGKGQQCPAGLKPPTGARKRRNTKKPAALFSSQDPNSNCSLNRRNIHKKNLTYIQQKGNCHFYIFRFMPFIARKGRKTKYLQNITYITFIAGNSIINSLLSSLTQVFLLSMALSKIRKTFEINQFHF